MKIKSLLVKWVQMPVWQQIIICLVLGMGTGLILGQNAEVFKPLGDAFINALHMVIVPVIFSAVVCAVTSVADFSQIRRVTCKAFVIYFSFLLVATLIAIGIGSVLQPGASLYGLGNNINSFMSDNIQAGYLGNAALEISQQSVEALPGFADIFVNMIPKNPVAAFVNENILQIVIFGILLGIAINRSGSKGEQVIKLFQSISDVSKNLTSIIMQFAPYGVFALIAWTFGMFGLKALLPLIGFIVSVFISCLVLVFGLYGSIIIFYLKQSPLTFLKKILPAIVFAISTTSSGATLPVSIKCAEDELRIPPKISKFLLPLGCNFNLSGLAIYLTLAVIFTANMYGIVLSPVQYLILVSTVVLTTMGTGAIPGSGIVVMSAVITTMGMPLGALPLIAGVDRINDMIQTTTNVISDIFAAYLVSESEFVPMQISNQAILDESLHEQSKAAILEKV
jgi:DAACS family dicarboxylate/amino acid:cation (Na+ or H+) symporter